MKTYFALFTFLGLVTLTGCSADDLTGPDADASLAFTQAAHSDTAPAAPSAEAFSVTGRWQASDASNSITLFLDDLGGAPDSRPSAAGAFEGKGVVSDLIREPLIVTVEGRYDGHEVSFTISDTHGGTVAKAQGLIARDFSAIKVILNDGSERERPLTFERF